MAGLRTSTRLVESAMDLAMEEYASEVEGIAAALKRRAEETAGAKNDAGEREHPTAYVENLTAAVSVPAPGPRSPFRPGAFSWAMSILTWTLSAAL